MTRDPVMLTDTAMVLVREYIRLEEDEYALLTGLRLKEANSDMFDPRWYESMAMGGFARSVILELVGEIHVLWLHPDLCPRRQLAWHLVLTDDQLRVCRIMFNPSRGTQAEAIRRHSSEFMRSLAQSYKAADPRRPTPSQSTERHTWMTYNPVMLSDTAMVLVRRLIEGSNDVMETEQALTDIFFGLPWSSEWHEERHLWHQTHDLDDSDSTSLLKQELLLEIWYLWAFPDISVRRSLDWHLVLSADSVESCVKHVFKPTQDALDIRFGPQTWPAPGRWSLDFMVMKHCVIPISCILREHNVALQRQSRFKGDNK